MGASLKPAKTRHLRVAPLHRYAYFKTPAEITAVTPDGQPLPVYTELLPKLVPESNAGLDKTY